MQQSTPELGFIFTIFAFITVLLFLAVVVIALVTAKLQGEKITLAAMPRLIGKGFRVWMGIALDDKKPEDEKK